MVTSPLSESEVHDVRAALAAMALASEEEPASFERLAGGVSCDVYRVDLADKTLCLKRALPKLRVAADWRAPAARSSSEVAWLKLAQRIIPGHVPNVLGEDRASHFFAMEFLPPPDYPVWKAQLATGHIDPAFAEDVGRAIARVHAATAGDADVAAAFANDAQFFALRLDPFLLYVAAKHEAVAGRLRVLAQGVAEARIALMHGDVSPKNILCGPRGPVFLDAETACYGDPAFDLAFCLNHLLLKCVWHPQWRQGTLACFARLIEGYVQEINWESFDALKGRTAALVPALLLARVDGKSPAEYLTDASSREFVRTRALALLGGGDSLEVIADSWDRALAHI